MKILIIVTNLEEPEKTGKKIARKDSKKGLENAVIGRIIENE